MNPALPDFESAQVLRAHVDATLGFYLPHAFDPQGGFFHYYLDDGTVYNRTHRHLVSATRLVFTWSNAHASTGREPFRDWARHALAHLEAFRIPSGPARGLYAWTLEQGRIEDATAMAYGQAFVLLARSHAHRIGLCTAQDVAAAFDAMEHAFYEPRHQAYADEITPAGEVAGYRGQNANMHMCEACLAAYEATGQARYLDRAASLIERFVFGLAAGSGDLVWEHYRPDWSIDWDYNRDNPGNIFKPWGFQTGHQTEWAKLLLIAHGHRPDPRYVERAAFLQQAAYAHGWDAAHGGLIYGFAPDFTPCDTDKYFWVQAESFASAWRLWRLTGDDTFRRQYHDTWAWSWRHLVDHQHGAWFRILSADGGKLENTKSPAGKVDYHTLGACWDVLAVGGLRT
jgi:mannose/cellobiose epimerase-like protein (N-acyl-D-glucosamine 2-epimerase family)